MIKYLLYLTLIICHTNASASAIPRSLFPLDEYLAPQNYRKFRIVHTFTTTHRTKIAVLENHRYEKFIVKQDISGDLQSAFKCALRDIVASSIARSAGVNANYVTFIPAGISFPGKTITNLPATLHNFVPGVAIKELSGKSRWRNASIHQVMKNGISPKKWGLTRTIITNMSLHPQLCRITAVDTFISNSDRNAKNYLYDEKTDTFYAIDFECSFRRNLAHHGCMTIEQMIQNPKKQLTTQERMGLKIYRDTLSQLIQQYTPRTIHDYFLAIAKKHDTASREQEHIVSLYEHKYASTIADNYISCKRLVTLIDTLLTRHQ